MSDVNITLPDGSSRSVPAGTPVLDIATGISRRSNLDGTEPEARKRLETLNGIHSNAAGFRRWLDHRTTSEGP